MTTLVANEPHFYLFIRVLYILYCFYFWMLSNISVYIISQGCGVSVTGLILAILIDLNKQYIQY